jgi:hypothetical protein
MGFIALALSSAEPFRFLLPATAVARVRRGLLTSLASLEHTRGIVPHFIDADPVRGVGVDRRSTIDSGWLVAGALWAAEFLGDDVLRELAARLYDRVDWHYWTETRAPNLGLLRHGADGDGHPLPWAWDRLNGETVFMYVLAAGAAGERAWPAEHWRDLRQFRGTVAGLDFVSADLGLFVFQYGLDLLDLEDWREPGGVDLAGEAALATEANYRACREAAERFATYREYWGLSAGDGPGDPPHSDIYRCYAPSEPLDGTAHLTATLASIAHRPDLVMENLARARRSDFLGRYGFSPINLDRGWVGRDMVGIDAGSVVLALDNFLHAGRVRRHFHALPCVRRGLDRIGFTSTRSATAASPAQLPRAA